MAFNDYLAELLGTVPKLPPTQGPVLLNRAWARVRDFKLWSFSVIADAQIFVPAGITAGTVTCTFNSTTVTVDAAAAAAFNAVGLGRPPIAGPLGTGRQLRIGASSGLSSPTGPNYTILNWDGTATLTIDKPYGETSVAGSQYQVLKCYYAAPGYPFASQQPDQGLIRFMSIINRLSGYSFFGKNLNWPQAKLNQLDPQRGGQGDAYLQANYGRSTTGTPVFELYPNPVNFTTYNALYVTRWPDISTAQDLPQMPYDLVGTVMYKAKGLAAEWALANVGTFPELQQTNWVAYQNMMEKNHMQSLAMSIKMDDELMPPEVRTQGTDFAFPLGGQFLQSHDISSLIPS